MEEERRLCYVGITRAMRQLYLSYAETRRLHGIDSQGSPSRFIREVPPDLLEEVRPRIQVSRPVYNSSSYSQTRSTTLFEETPSGIRLGQRVRHGKFGDGIVLNLEGQGTHARVEVRFENLGSKWLVLSYANLEAL
jgi:DNA helicase-2/ATP-dependent DNA helicase PcrA